jgi:hypothetical protein
VLVEKSVDYLMLGVEAVVNRRPGGKKNDSGQRGDE